METNIIHNIDNVKGLRSYVDDNIIDLTVTSPPYDDLRDYNDYQWDFKALAKELYRVTKEGGVVVWVVGDKTEKGSETGSSFKQALYFKEIGFNLHDTMIYCKNGPAYPANDNSVRYSQVFEYMFILSKGKPKTINLLKDRLNKWGGKKTFGKQSNRSANGKLKKSQKRKTSKFGYRFNIWKINNGYGYSASDDVAYKHPAIFPEQLAKDHIISWSNEADIVLDPFMGSGTTAKMAELLKRKWIGFELSEKYVDLAYKRVSKLDKNYLNELPEEERPAQQQLF